MPYFRKKPITIQASRWNKNGDHPLDFASDKIGLENGEPRVFSAADRLLSGWEGEIVRYFRRPDVSGATVCRHCGNTMHKHGWIDTLEGGHIVCPGDWIITGIKGEHYPCKPDIFDATYYEVTAPHDGKESNTKLPRPASDLLDSKPLPERKP